MPDGEVPPEALLLLPAGGGRRHGSNALADQVQKRKLAMAREGHWKELPTNPDLLARLSPEERESSRASLRLKPTRTLSGVSVVAVMTSPWRCPHGKCTYCPGGPELGTPQSYTGEEPSALRGAQFAYDPYRITQHRLQALEEIGHTVSKVEVILMGGTFSSRPVEWQETTIRRTFDALNGTADPSPSITEAHRSNEDARSRCVGLTVETRPDQASAEQLQRLVSWGVTRVEFGVESLRDEVLGHVHRAHAVQDVLGATARAREFGLKVGYHMMPGLPGMDPQRDVEDLARLFSGEEFQPDMLKVYPCLVIAGTGLFEEWKAGRYEPYDAETAARVLADAKERLPSYVRIQRVQRDIPARLIAAGVRKSNLRQLALRLLAERGRQCPCLRCRELGRRAAPRPGENWELERVEYRASGGREVFLALSDPETDAMAGFLRLRFPRGNVPGALTDPVIRELKVVGREVPVSGEAENGLQVQHRGLGKRLVRCAEEEARASGARRLFVIAAVGTRGYYAKLGFEREGPWMAKDLVAR
ncbi:MAG: tRNA uridine(34) 5-carboxymethylaminomethyl modification radical SAM/GNAT enzyme Elp3 [Euryarchaeota archaeon]|nr:tRNA uridine(34) 5-carboxymethylaminomethyl modification radical SAM/GNAT enzyme Elp3 [Euryarchaeota archaeon]MDE1835455.1 tRNA uridine(34) 5-carboxymethylaminomethyl modification radical SAM/GNAT enzyme Elp3 [Euryarchaeota archaeon]MDE1879591.1 tRNA uridine(34) 5-carboxymethylaminomethyl modification radical SAM/GNAT enzyme Elp3 [Euryarchaeota archaeon]MDE2046311.1 tRNA uridine(34) 5-carboxymethylaminomethyl modification radical SAM/GNAT enzyme Elp3 [Thermoplasmata archaeon]